MITNQNCKDYALVKTLQGFILGIAIGASITLAITIPLLEDAVVRIEEVKTR